MSQAICHSFRQPDGRVLTICTTTSPDMESVVEIFEEEPSKAVSMEAEGE